MEINLGDVICLKAYADCGARGTVVKVGAVFVHVVDENGESLVVATGDKIEVLSRKES